VAVVAWQNALATHLNKKILLVSASLTSALRSRSDHKASFLHCRAREDSGHFKKKPDIRTILLVPATNR
jgi:hypothetical protein